MDATTPFRRWLGSAALVVLTASGCQAADAARSTTARPQMPSDPVPASAVKPAAVPVAGLPLSPSRPMQAGFSLDSPPKPGSIQQELPAGDPRIKIVAIVGSGNIVTDEEVWEAVHQRPGDYLSQVEGPGGRATIIRHEDKEKTLYAEELRRIVERELILDEMYTRLKKGGKGQVIDEIKEFAGKAADRRIRDMKRAMRSDTDDDFALKLGVKGVTQPVMRRQFEREMMADEYVRSMMKEKGRSVSLTQIREYFDQHPEHFRTEDRVKWLDVFVSYQRFPTQRAAYDYALAVQQNAAAGADFVALSKQYDQGFAARQNGEGTGQKRGEILPADLEPTVWGLKVGEVSGLVETPAGYHVIKIAERETAGVRPFDDKVQAAIRRRLIEILHAEEYRKLVESLWRRGVVRVIEIP